MKVLCLLSAALFLIASVHATSKINLPGQYQLRFGATACPKQMSINRKAVLSGKGLQCDSNSTQLGLHGMTTIEGNQLTMHLSGGKPAAQRKLTKQFGEIYIATVKTAINCVNGTTPFTFGKGEIINFFQPVDTTVIHFSEVFAKPLPGKSAGHSPEHNLVAAVRNAAGAAHHDKAAGGHNATAGHKATGGKHNDTAGGHAGHNHSEPPCGVACQQSSGTPVSAADVKPPVQVGLRSGDRAQLKRDVMYMAFGSECLYMQSAEATCFPADAQVTLRDGRSARISEVRIGDEVSVGNGRFSRVFFWTHFDKHVQSQFVRLTTNSGNVLEASAGHFVYANGKMVPAARVEIGDQIPLSSGTLSKVVDITTVEKSGLFNPQTLSGDIVVNGIVASTYTQTVEPKIAHALLTPLRMVSRSIQSAFSMTVSV